MAHYGELSVEPLDVTSILQWELWFEVPGTRPPQAVPDEQVELDKAQRRGKKVARYFIPRFYLYFLGIVNEVCR